MCLKMIGSVPLPPIQQNVLTEGGDSSRPNSRGPLQHTFHPKKSSAGSRKYVHLPPLSPQRHTFHVLEIGHIKTGHDSGLKSRRESHNGTRPKSQDSDVVLKVAERLKYTRENLHFHLLQVSDNTSIINVNTLVT